MSNEQDNIAVKGCSELIVGFGLGLLACLLITLCACKSGHEVIKEQVPVVVTQEHHTESVRVDIVRDTIHQRDSIYHYIKGDTTIIERWHYYTNNNNAVRIDTLIKVDSVQVPVVTERVVTEVQEVEKPLKWWQRVLMMLGGVMLVGTGLVLAHWLGKRQKNI
jgi:hypothetical protein